MLLTVRHNVKDVQVTRWDDLHHDLQQRCPGPALRPDEQRGPDTARNSRLVELRLDVVGIADCVQRILVWNAVLVGAGRLRHGHNRAVLHNLPKPAA